MNTSCNIATLQFITQVEAIEPSHAGTANAHLKQRPCMLVLKNGTTVRRALCVEDHRGFITKGWIHPDDVLRVEPSPERMPVDLARKLYAAGESGMGYIRFRMKMRDGTFYVFVVGNLAVDFPDIPEGYTTDDIADVIPHEGLEASGSRYRQSRDFQWCFYVRPPNK